MLERSLSLSLSSVSRLTRSDRSSRSSSSSLLFSSSLLCRGNCTLPRPTADAATSNTRNALHSCVDVAFPSLSHSVCVCACVCVCSPRCTVATTYMHKPHTHTQHSHTCTRDQPSLLSRLSACSLLPSLSSSPLLRLFSPSLSFSPGFRPSLTKLR